MEAGFPFVETEDQLRVIREVKADMHDRKPMDRLICGDVGFGKTEVALRAAFKAVQDGMQVAVLVPTTVLAQQHYDIFRSRLSAFPVEIEMMSRYRNKAQQQEIIDRLVSGQVDIVIGTHRLLSTDIRFKRLGLMIIDEEQRFGVKHKEHFKKLRSRVRHPYFDRHTNPPYLVPEPKRHPRYKHDSDAAGRAPAGHHAGWIVG